MKIISKLVLTAPIAIIQIYQYLISPIMPGNCRHIPSCSKYAIEALNIHGLARGSILTCNRILRCHPWGTSGYDPVPEKNMIKIKKFPKRRLHKSKLADISRPKSKLRSL